MQRWHSSTKLFFIFILSYAASGCSKEISENNFPGYKIIPSLNTHQLTVYGDRNPVDVLYLGCGHLAVRYQQEVILIDPFFSTHGFLQKKVASKTNAFEKYQALLTSHGMDLSQTKSVWLAHTHYDHMMDVPLLLKKKILPENAVIYGNEFGNDILTNFVAPDQYHTLQPEEVYNPKTGKVKPKWIASSSANIRVMPILSDHAPHYKFGPFPIHLMKGNLKPHYFPTHLKDEQDVTKRGRWKEGCTYSFLIDFMEKDAITFRLFVQTSGSHYPLGRPPADVVKARAVDVALLCVASANYVKPYPIDILDTLKPRKVVFIHWEDFFRKPLDFEGARLVRFTNFRKLHRRLKRNGYEPNQKDYVMPRPGTLLTIN